MQLVVPALHAGGRRVGDVLPLRRPPDRISPSPELFLELLPRPGPAHALVDVVHQPELPTLPLGCRPVLPRGHPLGLRFLRLDHRISVGETELVAQLPELPKPGGGLMELASVLPTDGVDHEVGMGIVRIAVGADQNLMSRPGPLRKLQGQGVGIGRGNGSARVEGLGELVEKNAAGLAVDLFRQHELVVGRRSAAVDSADQIPAAHRIMDLFLLLAVGHDAAHGAGTLPVFGDAVHGCHVRSSVKARSLRIISACCSATSRRPGT